MNSNDRIHAIFKEGARARRTGTVNPYPGGSLFGQIHCYGWVQEDLRLALMDAKPSYREDQLRAESAYPQAYA